MGCYYCYKLQTTNPTNNTPSHTQIPTQFGSSGQESPQRFAGRERWPCAQGMGSLKARRLISPGHPACPLLPTLWSVTPSLGKPAWKRRLPESLTPTKHGLYHLDQAQLSYSTVTVYCHLSMPTSCPSSAWAPAEAQSPPTAGLHASQFLVSEEGKAPKGVSIPTSPH